MVSELLSEELYLLIVGQRTVCALLGSLWNRYFDFTSIEMIEYQEFLTV